MFFINTYRKGTPLTKRLGEEFLFWVRYYFRKIKYTGDDRIILVYPEFPSKKSLIWKIAQRLGYNVCNNPECRIAAAVHYQNSTIREIPAELAALKGIVKIANYHCNNISKTFVDEQFENVFGYGTEVDPLLHKGQMVMKSNGNAAHDGKVITGPVKEKDSNYIYQLLIDNTLNGNEVLDIRVPYLFGKIPFVYRKIRPVKSRFSNTNTHATIVETTEAFSTDEIEKLQRFCRNMRLDHGELDVLRDNNNGLIYVVDVNNTPYGPPNHLDVEGKNRAVTEFSSIFKSEFLTEKL